MKHLPTFILALMPTLAEPPRLDVSTTPMAVEMLAACISGPDRRVSPDECVTRLSCGDTDVDLEDYAAFQEAGIDVYLPWEFVPECCR